MPIDGGNLDSVYGLVVAMIFGLFIPGFCLAKACFKDGELEPGVALGVMAALLVVTGLLWRTQIISLLVVWYFLVIGASLAYPFVMKRVEKESRLEMRDQDIENSGGLWNSTRKNAAAHANLAEQYLQCDRFEEAITEFSAAIELNALSPNVGKWRRQLRDAQERQVAVGQHGTDHR